MKHFNLIFTLLLSIFFVDVEISLAQEERKFIREGNDHYEESDFEKARQSYLKGVEANAGSFDAAFNLGDALYKSGQYEEAEKQFQALTQTAQNSGQLSEAYHNLGNSYLEQQKYQESIEAYKNALRNNPSDDETRYNLAYAQQKLKEQQQQNQQNQDQNQDKDQDQQDQQNQDQQDQQNQDQQEQNKDQQNQQQQNQEQQGEEQQQQPQPQGISKEDAERLLEALQNQEQELQEEMKKKKAKAKSAKVEKDW